MEPRNATTCPGFALGDGVPLRGMSLGLISLPDDGRSSLVRLQDLGRDRDRDGRGVLVRDAIDTDRAGHARETTGRHAAAHELLLEAAPLGRGTDQSEVDEVLAREDALAQA